MPLRARARATLVAIFFALTPFAARAADVPPEPVRLLLFLGQFSAAKEAAAADPREAPRAGAYANLVAAERAIQKKQWGASRASFFKVEHVAGLEDVAGYWICKTYSAENKALEAEDCFKERSVDLDAIAELTAGAPTPQSGPAEPEERGARVGLRARKMRVTQARALAKTRKLRAMRATDGDLSLDDAGCRAQDCEDLFALYDASGNLLGFVGAWGVSMDGLSFDSIELASSKRQLGALATRASAARATRGEMYGGNDPGCSYGTCDSDKVQQYHDALYLDDPNGSINPDTSASLFETVHQAYDAHAAEMTGDETRAITVRQAHELSAGGKLRSTKTRASSEDAIDLDSILCDVFDCDHLYVVEAKDGQLLGVAPEGIFTRDHSRYDRSRLLTSKQALEAFRQARKERRLTRPRSLREIEAAVAPKVVLIVAQLEGKPDGVSHGSGVVVSPDGLILTSYHALVPSEGAEADLVHVYPKPSALTAQLDADLGASGIDARIEATDPDLDLALLSVPLEETTFDLIAFAPSLGAPGDPAIILGSPEAEGAWSTRRTTVTRRARGVEGRGGEAVYELDTNMEGADLGSAVLDQNGDLLGILVQAKNGHTVTLGADVAAKFIAAALVARVAFDGLPAQARTARMASASSRAPGGRTKGCAFGVCRAPPGGGLDRFAARLARRSLGKIGTPIATRALKRDGLDDLSNGADIAGGVVWDQTLRPQAEALLGPFGGELYNLSNVDPNSAESTTDYTVDKITGGLGSLMGGAIADFAGGAAALGATVGGAAASAFFYSPSLNSDELPSGAPSYSAQPFVQEIPSTSVPYGASGLDIEALPSSSWTTQDGLEIEQVGSMEARAMLAKDDGTISKPSGRMLRLRRALVVGGIAARSLMARSPEALRLAHATGSTRRAQKVDGEAKRSARPFTKARLLQATSRLGSRKRAVQSGVPTRALAVVTAERSLSPNITGGKFRALVVGVNRYQHINQLENAVSDARSVAQILKDSYGFEVTTLFDEEATRDRILGALNDARRTLTEKDSFLVYYSGHGEFNKDTETSYWIPVDAALDDNTKWLDARSISDQLKLITARRVLVVADSCFSGTITRASATDLTGKLTREAYLNKLAEKPARVLIASGGNEPVADGGARDHSLFAAVFLRALREPFAPVFTAEELMMRHIKEAVAGRSEQTPEYRVIRNSGHDGGDFIFVKAR